MVRGPPSRTDASSTEAEYGPAVPRRGGSCASASTTSSTRSRADARRPSGRRSFVRGAESVAAPYGDLVKPTSGRGSTSKASSASSSAAAGATSRPRTRWTAIAGYSSSMDGTAREWQRAATQWTPGKNFDGTMPIGPEVVTTDEIDVSDLQLTTTLNGEVMQSASTAQMIFDIPRTIEYLSSFTTLRPGDVIATGTPGGVGFAGAPGVAEPGDLLEVEIEGVGRIANRVVAEDGELADWPWIPPTPDEGDALEAAPPREHPARGNPCAGADQAAASRGGTHDVGDAQHIRLRPSRSQRGGRRALVVPAAAARRRSWLRRAHRSSAAAAAPLTVADVAPFTGTDAALGPTYLVSCDAATNAIDKAGGVLGHTRLQGGRHPRRPGRRRARRPSDVRVDLEPRARDRLHLRRGGLGGPDLRRQQDGLVLHDRAVGVRPRQVPVLLPAGAARPVGVLRDGRDRTGLKDYKRVALAFGNDIGSQTFVRRRSRRSRRPA